MKEVKDCKIVQDLLPSYIDGLTNKDTNQYIEEHLEECPECKKELKAEVTKKDSKEVKYIKKFNNKMKILKTVLLVILLIFILSVGRKMAIIASLNNKINEYTTSTNYYIKAINNYGDSLIITETYKKDNKYVNRIKFLSENSKNIYTDYYNGETINGYYQTGFEEGNISTQIVREKSYDNISQPVIPSKVEIENPIKFVVMSIFSSITSEKCNEKDCYKVVINTEDAIYYIDKETGLTLRTIGAIRHGKNAEELYDVITDYQYKFDVVTDDDFIEPDISEYDTEE